MSSLPTQTCQFHIDLLLTKWEPTLTYAETGIPYLANMRKKSICVEVYKAIHNLSIHNFKPRENTRTLRSNESFLLEQQRTCLAFSESDLMIRGCCYWELLPTSIKAADSLNTFKASIGLYDFG